MPARLLSIAFATGLALFAALLAAGFYRAFDLHGRPMLRANYGQWINELAGREDWEALSRQLRLSATLDLGEPGVEREILPNLIRVARKTGDRENEIFARRRLAELHRESAASQLRLVDVLLAAPDASAEELREAAFHARLALELDPGATRRFLEGLERRNPEAVRAIRASTAGDET